MSNVQDPIRIILYDHQLDTIPKLPDPLTLEEFFSWLSEHQETNCAPCSGKKCPQKFGQAWSPGWIPLGKTRFAANVEALDVLAFDLDDLTEADFYAMRERFEGLTRLLYTTHTHRPDLKEFKDNKGRLHGGYRARVVFALSRRVWPKEYPILWASVARRYGFLPDEHTKDVSRIFFTPSCPAGMPRINESFVGAPLDVDALLLDQLRYVRESNAQIRARVETSPFPVSGEVDVGGLRAALRKYSPHDDYDGKRREQVRRVLTGEPLADRPGCASVQFNGPALYGRDSTVISTAFILGLVLPIGTPADAAMEVLRPSIMSMPQYEDDDRAHSSVDAWMELAKKHYETGAEKNLQRGLERKNGVAFYVELARRRAAEGKAKVVDDSADDDPEGDDESNESVTAAGKSEEDDDAWRLLLKYEKDGKIAKVSSNVTTILTHHPAWRGVLRFNILKKDVECMGGPLPEAQRKSSRLDVAIDDWLQINESLVVSALAVGARIVAVSRDREFSPVAEYLRSLTWDGENRIDTFLESYCRARLQDDDGVDLSEFVRLVSRRWFIGAVARAIKPGCKMDNVLVLQGEEGLKKSEVFKALGNPFEEVEKEKRFVTNTPVNLDSREARMAAGRWWIIEMAELTSIRRSENETQKTFFSSENDDIRLPYGKTIESFDRCSVFVGTTNEEKYLISTTGNRRFWCVFCAGEQDIDIKAIKAMRDQLWAEAVVAFDAGERWWLTRAEDKKYLHISESHVKDPEGEVASEAIMEWWTRVEPDARPARFTLLDVAVEALQIPKNQLSSRCAWLGRTLSRLGFERKRCRLGGSLTWMYQPTEEIRLLPRVDKSRRHLSLIANAMVPVSGVSGTPLPEGA